MTILIKADRLIDGTGAPPLERATLIVDGPKIVGVFAGDPPPDRVPPDAAVLDYPGCTILPGLIDIHVHLNLPGDGTVLEEVAKEPDGVLVATATFGAARALAAGITTVRDVGAARSTVFHVRRALELGHGHGSRIMACGQPLTITGGHTWYFGGEADGPDGLRRKVREMAKLGADFIKVMASGGGTLNTMSWLSSFSPAELSAIVDESHRLDRKVTAHCLCAQSISDAVDAGVDQIEHAGFIADPDGTQRYVPEVGDKLARSGIPVTGTLAVGGSALAAMEAKTERTPAEEIFYERWKRMFADNMAQFAKLRGAGVKFVAGTDGGWRYTPVDGLPMEIDLMRQGGLSAMDALVSATGFSAKVQGMEDRFGTLKPGLAADVVVVPGNPLDDTDVLSRTRLVMQAGQVRATDGRPVAERPR